MCARTCARVCVCIAVCGGGGSGGDGGGGGGGGNGRRVLSVEENGSVVRALRPEERGAVVVSVASSTVCVARGTVASASQRVVSPRALCGGRVQSSATCVSASAGATLDSRRCR